jgi:hypothetical protein
MLRIFKSVFALYILAAVIGLVGFVVSGTTVVNDVEYGFGLSIFEGLVLFFIWIIFVIIILYRIVGKKLAKINKLLDDCKVSECVSAYEKLSKNPAGEKGRMFIHLSLSTGYIYLGDTERLKQSLDKVLPNVLKSRRSIDGLVEYYNNYILYYLSIDDIESAEECLQKMKAAYDNPRVSQFRKVSYDNNYMNKRIRINIEKGEFDGAEAYYKLLLETKKKKIEKVAIHYSLGEVYTHYGRTDEAKAAFSYCVEHGGDTIYVSKSKEKLI